MPVGNNITVTDLGLQEYAQTWQAMRDYTEQRSATDSDQLWLVEHPPVYTLGRNGKDEHILNLGQIPLIESDRGGQITYHGPGQIIAYVLVDIRRRDLGVRALVTAIEQSIIKLLADTFGIEANADPKAPGVYVDGRKIASLGLRIKNGCSYHGVSLNTCMDLQPFEGINPCGYENLAVTQISEFDPHVSLQQVKNAMIKHIVAQLGYDTAQDSLIKHSVEA